MVSYDCCAGWELHATYSYVIHQGVSEASEHCVGAVRWSKDNHARSRGDVDVQVGGVRRLCRCLAIGRFAVVERQALRADVLSTEDTQVTESLSICKISHSVVNITQDPGTVDMCRFVSAKSSGVLLEDFILVATMQRFRNSRDPKLLHEIGDKPHAIDHTHGLLLIPSAFVGAVYACALTVVGNIISFGFDSLL